MTSSSNSMFTASRLLRRFAQKDICKLLIMICSVAVAASAQRFKQVTGSLVQVSAGRNEVFDLDSSFKIWRFSGGKFVNVPGLLLAQVAMGGGTLLLKDEIWGVGGAICQFNYGTKTFSRVNGILTQIAVCNGYQDKCHPYEVWGINASDQIYRYNYCEGHFDQISGHLAVVATGGGDVWGINSSNQIYHFDCGLFTGVPFANVQVYQP